MSATGSITHWLQQLQIGDEHAFQKLWETYFQRLVGLVRHRLRSIPGRAADEEDVALSAFDSFYRGVQAGRFPRLLDRDDLWQLLMVIASRKATNLVQRERRRKRGGDKVRVALDQAAGHSSDDRPVLSALIDREPDPALVAQVAEECARLLGCLDTDELRSVALWKMEGFTNEEIAARLARSTLTVTRKLRLIRHAWEKEVDS